MKPIFLIFFLALTIATFSTFASAETYTLTFNSTGITDIKEDNNSTLSVEPFNSTGITTIEEKPNNVTPVPETPSVKSSSYSSPIEALPETSESTPTPTSNTTLQSSDDPQVDSQETINDTISSEQESTSTIPLAFSTPLILLFVAILMRKKA